MHRKVKREAWGRWEKVYLGVRKIVVVFGEWRRGFHSGDWGLMGGVEHSEASLAESPRFPKSSMEGTVNGKCYCRKGRRRDGGQHK